MESHNKHQCIKYLVTATFVSQNKEYGYQKTEVVHHNAKSAHEAASIAMISFCDEDTPIAGIAVYECVLTY